MYHIITIIIGAVATAGILAAFAYALWRAFKAGYKSAQNKRSTPPKSIQNSTLNAETKPHTRLQNKQKSRADSPDEITDGLSLEEWLVLFDD